ncbi:MAG: amino acid adenylation domain-containing protein [Anaerolineae bacterium]
MEKQSILARRLNRAKSRDLSQQSIQPQNQTGITNPVLSFAQERFWFLDQLNPNDPSSNRPFAWVLTGQLDQHEFKKTVSAIVQRHTVLRTLIISVDDQPQAKIIPTSAIDIPIIHLADEPEAVQHRLLQLTKEPIPLDLAPLIRVTLIKLSDQKHIALFVMHHITFDALSEEVFKREFQALYNYHLNEAQPIAFPQPSLQYSDFSHWQRGQIAENRLQRLESFWTDQLANPPQISTFLTDNIRPEEKTNRGDKITIDFPADLVSKLTHFSHDQNTTLFTTLLATFYLLLHRYTQQTDILIGTPVSGRNHPDFQDVIGFFTNTVVLRGDLSADPTFTDFLRTIRKMTLTSFDHQDYPIEKLFETIPIEREANIPPLFQILFNLENVSPAAKIVNGPTIETLSLKTETAIYDLSVELQNDGAQLSGSFTYSSDIFNASTIKRITHHYLNLLASVLTHSDRPISSLPLLTQSEQNTILYAWNQTDVPYETSLAIHKIFEQQVLQSPDQVALKEAGQTLTYAQLNARSNQLARHLIKRGVGPDKLVGLFLERSIDMFVGLVAILKAGGAYVPIDPQLPRERIEFMLADSQVEVVLTEKSWQDHLPNTIQTPICVDNLPPSVSAENAQNLELKISPDTLAYMIYTSGSTGTPKGVMITQRNLHNYVQGRERAGIYTQSDTMLHGSTLSFDIAVEEIFCPLLLGGRIIILNRIGFKDIDLILDTIQQEQVTAFSTTPSVLTQCLSSPKLKDCTHLSKVILGGEALTIDLKNRWLQQTGIPLINSYGPTETTVDVTTYRCQAKTPYPTIPIGRPSANTKIYIVDQHLQPTPIGVAGEILIGGDPVGRGYWNRPELTAEKFIPNPYAPGRLYRTGDLGRFLADGNIEFLGRIDHQTKIRGFRVELGEIEATILKHADIAQAVVLAPEINGSKQLVAYVVPDKQSACSSILKQFLADKLPDYMIPPYIVMLDQLPLMLNGKVNLKELPLPSSDHLTGAKRFIPPHSDIEKQVAAIWSETLKITQIGTQDNFFDLGGHSLLVTKVISRMRSSMGIEFPMKTFFELPKLADQAEILELMLET